MGDQIAAAIARARKALAAVEPALVEKTIFASPAGKKRLSKRLAAMLPAHKVYVEPFAGSAAVFFAKEPADVEVLSDADTDIAEAYRTLKSLTADEVTRLGRMNWIGDEATFKKLYSAKPTGRLEKLHRFLYVSHFSYGKMGGSSFSPSIRGVEARTMTRIERFLPRLKKARIYGGDYEKVARKYDGAGTVFFLDPPYAGYDADVGESKFDEERFFKMLKALEGKWLLTYGARGKLPGLLKQAGYPIKRIKTPRTIGSMAGVGGPAMLTQLIVANYKLTHKSFEGSAWELEDWEPEQPTATAASAAPPRRPARTASPSPSRCRC